VTIRDYVYAPDPVRVRAGSSVTWTNNDAAPHTASADDGGWDSGSLTEGKSGTVRFDTPGTYSYHCALHPTMKGKVVVTG
jgi:plastocyanin